MLDFAAAGVEHNRFAIVFSLLAANLRKERRKAVIVVHRPAIERMVMALRTLRANAHEHLSYVFGQLKIISLDIEKVSRRDY